MFKKFREAQAEAAPNAAAEAAIPAPVPADPPRHDESALARARRRQMTDLRQGMHQALLAQLNLPALVQASEGDIKAEINEILRNQLPGQTVALSRAERVQLVDDLYNEVMGLGPLEYLIRDETISDILINGPEQVFVERSGVLELTDVQFQDESHLRRIVQKIVASVGRRLDESTPYVDARLPEGSRLNAIISPIALDGTLVSIRKFRKDKLSLAQLVAFGALDERMARYLEAAVATRLNIIVSGGTGSGKTTLLNALSSFIGKGERILTVEDTAELQLQQVHVGRMESRPPNVEGKGAVTQRDCLRNALRMRPDRIIVGETRGDEVIDMLQAMNTGHDGSMTTIHANSARDATSRLENMVAMAGIEIPLSALRRQIASAVNVIVQVTRFQDGTRRVTSITEITGCEGDILTMQELFRYENEGMADGRVTGAFVAEGTRSHYSDRFRRWGHVLPADLYARV